MGILRCFRLKKEDCLIFLSFLDYKITENAVLQGCIYTKLQLFFSWALKCRITCLF